MSKVYVSARLFPKADKIDDVVNEIRKTIPLVRQEKGCLRYDLHRSADGKAELMFYEIWEDQAALKAHSVADHMEAMRERIKDMLEKPGRIMLWEASEVAEG
jgi:quinol monooxygenase YgiN